MYSDQLLHEHHAEKNRHDLHVYLFPVLWESELDTLPPHHNLKMYQVPNIDIHQPFLTCCVPLLPDNHPGFRLMAQLDFLLLSRPKKSHNTSLFHIKHDPLLGLSPLELFQVSSQSLPHLAVFPYNAGFSPQKMSHHIPFPYQL